VALKDNEGGRKVTMGDFERIIEKLRLKSEAFKALNGAEPLEAIKYDCSICQDREIILVEQADGSFSARNCECKARKVQKRLFKASGLTEEQSALRLDDFKPDEDTRQMYLLAQNYIDRQLWKENKGFAFVGSVGSGKTMLAQIIASEIMLDKKTSVIFLPTTSLMAELRVAQFSDGGAEYEQRIDRLINADVVIFDDVGKEKPTEWVQTQYFRIIDGRYNQNKTTSLTSNYGFGELSERFPEFGDAIISRLIAMTRDCLVKVNASDYRLLR
jgi:DNA replication protein DnaC